MFKFKFDSPEVKQNLISSVTKLYKSVASELFKDLRLIILLPYWLIAHGIFATGRAFMPAQEKKTYNPRELIIIMKILKSCGYMTYWSVFLPEKNIGNCYAPICDNCPNL